MRIHWTRRALRKLNEIAGYISRERPSAASRQMIDTSLVVRCLQAFGISLSTFHRFYEGVAQEERVLRDEGAPERGRRPPGTPPADGRDGDRLLILRQEAGEEVELEVCLKLR